MKSIFVNFVTTPKRLIIQVSYNFLTIFSLPLLQTDQRLFLKLNLRKFFFHRDFFFCENSTSATLLFTNVHTAHYTLHSDIWQERSFMNTVMLLKFKSGSNFHFSDDGKFVYWYHHQKIRHLIQYQINIYPIISSNWKCMNTKIEEKS